MELKLNYRVCVLLAKKAFPRQHLSGNSKESKAKLYWGGDEFTGLHVTKLQNTLILGELNPALPNQAFAVVNKTCAISDPTRFVALRQFKTIQSGAVETFCRAIPSHLFFFWGGGGGSRGLVLVCGTGRGGFQLIPSHSTPILFSYGVSPWHFCLFRCITSAKFLLSLVVDWQKPWQSTTR